MFPYNAYFTGRKEILYIIATGGQVIRYGDWLVHEFYGSDTFEVTQTSEGALNDIEYFGEAGGGAGGGNSDYYGAGGGGGGDVSGTWPAAVGSYPIVIGAGGAIIAGTQGANGSDTTMFGQTAEGGGGGGGKTVKSGANGGSGGGATENAAVGVGSQGFNGGQGSLAGGGGGGGGGLGTVGANGNALGGGGNGGDGISTLITGLISYYGGGGGGGGDTGTGGIGGIGGGGNGSAGGVFPTDGGVNTGGGGGGRLAGPNGNGGSGFGAAKYFKPAPIWPSSVPLPIAGYHLDGNANDYIGSNNGTTTAITWQQGKINDGAKFNGTTSQIIASNPISGTSGSFSFFIKQGSNPALSIPIFFGGTTYFAFLAESNLLGIDVNATGFGFINITVSPLYFTHVIITWNGTTLNVYENGVLVFTTPKPSLNTGGSFYLGNIFSDQWAGSLDEITYFNYVLTPTQAADLNAYYNS